MQLTLAKIQQEQMTRKDDGGGSTKHWEMQVTTLQGDIKWLRETIKDAQVKQDNTDKALREKSEEMGRLYQQLDDLRSKNAASIKSEQDEWKQKIGRAVQQECRDRSRMPSSA
eukprot:TRINITY_DN3271_c1_g1_i2.p1 TRINITY_DN3271_c1_g1~~TRINITY_DN3271_c1_g1_i2.p1  ORF type:complete len:113 (-),score=26.37 TRINITY_DN3271_c1_g1_i2:23-361(-)